MQSFKEIHKVASKLTEFQREATRQSGFIQITGSVFEVHATGMVAIHEKETNALVFAYFNKKDPKLLFLNKEQKIEVAGTLVVGKYYELNNPVMKESITSAYSRMFD